MNRTKKQKIQYLIWRISGINLYFFELVYFIIFSITFYLVFNYLINLPDTTFYFVVGLFFVGILFLALFYIVTKIDEGTIYKLEKDILACTPWKERKACLRIVKDIARIKKLEFKYGSNNKIKAPNCYLYGAELQKMDLRNSNFENADLRDADLRDSKLSQSNFDHANLVGTNMRGADLEHANLQNADLSYANLESANLSHADLKGANLNNANLTGAILFASKLDDALLNNTKVRGAEFKWTQLNGAVVNDENFLEELRNWNWSCYEHINEVYFISQEQTEKGDRIYKLRRNPKPSTS